MTHSKPAAVRTFRHSIGGAKSVFTDPAVYVQLEGLESILPKGQRSVSTACPLFDFRRKESRRYTSASSIQAPWPILFGTNFAVGT
jgi:hypothetical protein